MAAPTVNNVVTGSFDAGTTQTLSAYTPSSGANSKLIVCAPAEDNEDPGNQITGITFDGNALTKIAEEVRQFNTNSMWFLDSPGTSAGDIVATWAGGAGSHSLIACTLLGAASGAAEASNTKSQTTNSITTTITTIANNALIVSTLSHQGATVTLTEGTGETEHADFDYGTGRGGFSSKVDVAAGAETMNWVSSTSGRNVHVIASIAPAAGAPSGNPYYAYAQQ